MTIGHTFPPLNELSLCLSVDHCGYWPLKSCAEGEDLAGLKWLIANGANLEQTSTGDTALHKAACCEDVEAVRALIEAGANVNAEDVDGETPLFCSKSHDIIELLIKAGARLDPMNIVGQTPLTSRNGAAVRAYLGK